MPFSSIIFHLIRSRGESIVVLVPKGAWEISAVPKALYSKYFQISETRTTPQLDLCGARVGPRGGPPRGRWRSGALVRLFSVPLRP